MKSSGSFLTRSSRKRIACSLPSALAGTGRAAGTVVDDEFDGADERPLPQPAPDRRERQSDRATERRSDGATERRGDEAKLNRSLSLSLCRPVPPSPRRPISLTPGC